MTETPIRATQAARWPHGQQGRCTLAGCAGAAALLHIAVFAVVLTGAHVPAPPVVPDDQAVEVVFAPPQAEPPEPTAQTAPPAPPVPDQPPTPMEAPAPPNLPTEPEPVPPPVIKACSPAR